MTALRKIVEWIDVTGPRLWNAKLECGHVAGEYSDGIDDAQKVEDEKTGFAVCSECSRVDKEIENLEKRLREAKARRTPSSSKR
jgi:hypothetical protein